MDMKMSKLISFTAYVVFLWLLNLDLKSALTEPSSIAFDTSKDMVGFLPYVSVLDKYNRSRYGIDELVQLFKVVATRFERVYIELDIDNHFNNKNTNDQSASLLKSPLAAATYNCLPLTKKKIEVFLDVKHYGEVCNCNMEEFYLKLYPILELAETANIICNRTVTSILVRKLCGSASCFLNKNPEINSEDLSKALKFRRNYFWGVSVSFVDYCDGDIGNYQVGQLFNISVLLIFFSNISDYVKQNLTQCKLYNNKNNQSHYQLIKGIIPSAVEGQPKRNMSSLVSIWKTMQTQPSDIYLISFAFDSYHRQGYFDNGWWYLLQDPGSTNTSQFVFNEKIISASVVDFMESPKNYTWLQNEPIFNKNKTGILVTSIGNFYNPFYMAFCNIIAFDKYSTLEITSAFKNLNDSEIKVCKKGRNVYTLPVRNVLIFQNVFKVSVQTISETGTKIRFGYAYPLDTCGKLSNPYTGPEKFHDRLNSQNISVIMFYFLEDTNSIKLGSTKLVRDKIVLFEKCKEMVQQVSRNKKQIVFVSLGYPMMVNKFYSSVEAMHEYVKYVYLLNDWVETQVNIVTCIGFFEDHTTKFYSIAESQSYVGFYSFNRQTSVYAPKSRQAYDLSKLYYPDFSVNATGILEVVGFNTNHIFIVFGTLAFVCVFITLLARYLIQRYKKNNVLPKSEIEEFFTGDMLSDNNVQKSVYDKEKYEIGNENFEVEFDVALGSGEFGAVYRGFIITETEKNQVAIKTSNPQKFHKTQLTGLLSEIKVLAHVGKHANIIELLGANTESIEKGKVYIFLEFCHHGSLKTYLRKLRLLISSPVQDTAVDSLPDNNGYENASATNSTLMDAGLSEDLYRWSAEICNGMAFLAEKHVVHADLAIRNVLLNLKMEAKICDFGLSRRMYNYTNYVKKQQEPIPWKWMSPEALSDMQFNEKTDVWSYGVTLWELYSLGNTPYAGLSWDPNFSQMLERGMRLSAPEYCERNMYKMMQKSWVINPDHRPRFSEIFSMLNRSEGSHAMK